VECMDTANMDGMDAILNWGGGARGIFVREGRR